MLTEFIQFGVRYVTRLRARRVTTLSARYVAALAGSAVLFASCGGNTTNDPHSEEHAGGRVEPAPQGGSAAAMQAGQSSRGGTGNGGDSAGSSAAGTAGDSVTTCSDSEFAPAALDALDQAALEPLRGVTLFVGRLHIGGEVNDLSPLACLTRVAGELEIEGTSELHSLHGLEQLKTIGGDATATLRIANNQGLESLGGLDSLATIAAPPNASPYLAGELTIVDNPRLTSSAGLSRLTRVARRIDVSRNSLLRDLWGLDSLFSLPRLDAFTVVDNPEVQTCEAERLAQSLKPALVTIVGGAENRGDGSCEPPFH